MHNILIVDDDKDICLLLARFLKKNDYEAEYTQTGKEAVDILKKTSFDLVFCDYKLPDMDGVELIQKIKILHPKAAIIMITGYSDVKIAVKALRHGAYDYVTKPLYPEEILDTIKNALESQTSQTKNKLPGFSKTPQRSFVFGPSQQSKTLRNHIELIAPTDMSVIILGETGTGKEYVANEIHKKSKRADKPFIAIDCGALPKELAGSELFGHIKGAFTGAISDKTGSFQLADGGTLFLDEIGNLTYDNQIKLLRVLQERKIKKIGGTKDIDLDVRLIVATNENLDQSIADQSFRKDLYYRLNEFKIEISPLRDRQSDIPVFADHFLKNANESLGKDVEGFTDDAIQKLKDYYWHGNLRELQNVVKRSVLLCQGNKISLNELPDEIVHSGFFELEEATMPVAENNLKMASIQAEREIIISALKKSGYNKSKTAKELKIDRKTLYNKLKAFEINF